MDLGQVAAQAAGGLAAGHALSAVRARLAQALPGGQFRAAPRGDWDLASPQALSLGGDAMAAAVRLAADVRARAGEWVAEVAAVPPGFVNVRLSAAGWEAVCAELDVLRRQSRVPVDAAVGPGVGRAQQRCRWLEAMARRERPDAQTPRLQAVPAGAANLLRGLEAVPCVLDRAGPGSGPAAALAERIAGRVSDAYERIPMLRGTDGDVGAWRRILGSALGALELLSSSPGG